MLAPVTITTGKFGLFGANFAQDVQPAGSRQIEIQDHEIVWPGRRPLLRFRSVGDHLYSKLLLFQPLMQKFCKRRVIFSDKMRIGSHETLRL